jgi:hypothetical protein
MFGRAWRNIALLFAALLVAASSPSAPARIVAIGDLHGDYEAWRAIAGAARLIDARGHWIGGRTVLVQTGDVPDRGPDTLRIIDDLMRLQREARRAGGQVIALVGNHEAMNVTGDLRYVHPGEYAAFVDRRSATRRSNFYSTNRPVIEGAYKQQDPKLTSDEIRKAWIESTPLGRVEHRAAWHPRGRIGRWIIGNPAVTMLGGTLFVHGGLSIDYSTVPLAEINRRTAAALKTRATTIDAIINDPRGPLWYRGLVTRTPDAEAPTGAEPARVSPPIEAELAAALHGQGATRMVIGHTPTMFGIMVLHEGRLVRIDTGISRHYGGKLTFLEVANDVLTPHVVARPTATGP